MQISRNIPRFSWQSYGFLYSSAVCDTETNDSKFWMKSRLRKHLHEV